MHHSLPVETAVELLALYLFISLVANRNQDLYFHKQSDIALFQGSCFAQCSIIGVVHHGSIVAPRTSDHKVEVLRSTPIVYLQI